MKFQKARNYSIVRKMSARWQSYLLLLLPVLYIAIFAYGPMGGLIIAFKDYDFTKGILQSDWVGLDNFLKFFNSYKFPLIMRNTLTVSIYSLMVSFPIPIIFALLLNALPFRRYKQIIQTTTYIPYFISTVVMVGLLLQLLNYRTGLYGVAYQTISGEIAPNILDNGSMFKHIYVWSGVWQSMGYNAIIYIAALSNVDQQLHDAARIDGAGRMQRVWYIDFPSIKPTACIMLILAVGNIMNIGFEKALLMQNNMNINYSEMISTYVYKVGLTNSISDFSLSATISMFNSVINFVLLLITNWLSKKLNGTGIF